MLVKLEELNFSLDVLRHLADGHGKLDGSLTRHLEKHLQMAYGRAMNVTTCLRFLGLVEQVSVVRTGVPIYRIDTSTGSLALQDLERALAGIEKRRSEKRQRRLALAKAKGKRLRKEAKVTQVTPSETAQVRQLQATIDRQRLLIVTLTSKLIEAEALLEPAQ
jgi:hypothetical protein